IFALKKFQPYIYGQKFTIYTDHQPLVHIRAVSTDELVGRLGRWILYLEQYSPAGFIQIVYKQGRVNSDADAMSRLEFTNVVRALSWNTAVSNTIERAEENKASIPKLPAMDSSIITSSLATEPTSTMVQKQKEDLFFGPLYKYVCDRTF